MRCEATGKFSSRWDFPDRNAAGRSVIILVALAGSALPSLMFAAIAERCGFPRPARGERATRAERKPDLGPVRGRSRKLRLAEAPLHPDLLHSPSRTGV